MRSSMRIASCSREQLHGCRSPVIKQRKRGEITQPIGALTTLTEQPETQQTAELSLPKGPRGAFGQPVTIQGQLQVTRSIPTYRVRLLSR